VLIARGRDAADVAIATTFGQNTLENFKVLTDEVAQSVPPGRLACESDYQVRLNTVRHIIAFS
jgi:hypothetical protein